MNYFVKSVFVFLCFSVTAFGQIEKGNKYIWGKLYVPSEYFNSDLRGFNIYQSVEYLHFIQNGLAIHTDLGFQYTRLDTQTGIDKTINTSLQLDFRKYFKLNQYLFPYVGIGLSTVYDRRSVSYYGVTSTNNTQNNSNNYRVDSNFGAGMMYVLSPVITVSANIKSSIIPISFSNINLGLAYSLRKLPFNDSTKVIEQTKNNNWILSGGFSSNFIDGKGGISLDNSSDNSLTSGQSVSLSFGKFITKKRVIGLSFDVSNINQNYTYINGSNSTANFNSQRKGSFYTLSPYFKKYYGKGRLNLYVRTNASIYYYRQSSHYTSANNSYSDTNDNFSYGFGVSYGLAYFLGKHFIIETGLGQFYLSKSKDQPRYIYLSLISPPIQFSLNYVFLKK